MMVFVRYTAWHYREAPGLLLKLWMNLLWYLGHAFSMKALGSSLFSPWKRIEAKRTKRWDFEDWASAILANFISRIIGAIMRLVLIVAGLTLQLLLLLVGGACYLIWFFIPLLLLVMFLTGLGLLL